jgi:hypothetical protein
MWDSGGYWIDRSMRQAIKINASKHASPGWSKASLRSPKKRKLSIESSITVLSQALL